MTKRAPKLRIDIERPQRRWRVSIKDDKNNEVIKSDELLDTRRFEKLQRRINENLDNFKSLVENNKLTVGNVSNALSFLYEQGLLVIGQLFSKPYKVEEIFVQQFPNWENKVTPSIIEIYSPIEYSIPFEVLPFFDISNCRPPKSRKEIEKYARKFIGFSTIINHQIEGATVNQENKLKLTSDKRLPIKFFFDNSLPGAQLEETNLLELQENGKLDLEGPWPSEYLEDEILYSQFLKHIFLADKKFNMRKRRYPYDQLHHFSCHCENEDIDSRISLSYDKKITLERILIGFTKYSQQIDQRKKLRPIIFFNACESATIDAAGLNNFPKFFLKKNLNRGFIGANTKIQDTFAADFSKSFYDEILRKNSIGLSLYNAKVNLLSIKNNPLGLLYSFFGNPDICIEDK